MVDDCRFEGELIAHKLDQSWNKFVYMYAGHDSMMIPFLSIASQHDAQRLFFCVFMIITQRDQILNQGENTKT